MTGTVREASRLGQFSWALFDWANQPFFTVVTTFIFAPYYANVMIGDAGARPVGLGVHPVDLRHPDRAA